MTVEATLFALTWTAIVVLAFAVAGLLRQVDALRHKVAPESVDLGPRTGHMAPNLAGVDWDGTTVLLFMKIDCPGCALVADALRRGFATRQNLRIIGVFPEKADGFLPETIEKVEDRRDAFTAYEVKAAPFGVAVSANGRVIDTQPIGSPDLLAMFLARVEERILHEAAS